MNQADTLFKINHADWISFSDAVPQWDSTAMLKVRFLVQKEETSLVYSRRQQESGIPSWVHLSLFFWVIIILITRLNYTFKLRQLLAASFNLQHLKQFHREGNILKQGYPVLLIALYLFTISMFGLKAIDPYLPKSFHFSFLEKFFLFFGGVFSVYFLKFSAIWFLGKLFDTAVVTKQYLLDHYLFQITEGLILFPLLILYVYSSIQIILFAAIAVLLMLWAYRLMRAVRIGFGCTNFSWSYLFLYLCTLEVLPLFFVYKLSV
ncbi:MAG TPA: hypothetical protein DCG69_03980 [Bacteroidales bacterium]|nr:hypothetical protein [Bacteroidales bacterium]